MNVEDEWDALEAPWREALELTWEAYCANTIPVGAVIVDGASRIVTRGRNRIFEATAPAGELANTWLAHAEVNALVGLPPGRYPDHVLYTAMEPCALCFGAALISTVGTVRYAAPDPIGASSAWADRIAHRTRSLVMEGPLENPFARLVPLLVVENITRRVPDSATARILLEERSDLLPRVDELRRRDLPTQALAGLSFDEARRALWDLIE